MKVLDQKMLNEITSLLTSFSDEMKKIAEDALQHSFARFQEMGLSPKAAWDCTFDMMIRKQGLVELLESL